MRRGGAIGLVALVVSAVVWAITPPTPTRASTAATGVTATASPTLSNTVDVQWTAPTTDPDGQTFVGYNVYTFDAGNAQVSVSAVPSKSTTELAVDGLTNGQPYTFRVDSIYSGGTVVASATSSAATPYGVPSGTTFDSATPGDGRVVLEWAAAADNGSAITDYVLTNRLSQATISVGPVLTATVSGLANGISLQFDVTPYNARGAGPISSTPSPEVTPVGAPVAPTVTSSSAGDGTASIEWSIGTENTATGGSPIDYFTLTPSQGAPVTVQETVASYTFQGLTNGQDYTFTITATNEAGFTGPQANVGPLTPVGAGSSTIASVTPTHVDRSAIAELTLSGTALGSTTAVFVTCPATSATTSATIVGTPSSTLVDVTVSAGACANRGAVTVSAVVGLETISLTDAYFVWDVPTVTSVTPSSGSLLGGAVVTVEGTGFVAGSTTVGFGTATVSASSVAVDGTTLSAVVPPSPGGALGAVALSVTIAAQPEFSVESGVTYTYVKPPGTVTIDGLGSSYPFGTTPFSVGITRTPSNTVTAAALTPGVCEATASADYTTLDVTVSAVGTCTIEVGLAGDSTYSEAFATGTFAVTPGVQTVTITSSPRMVVGSTLIMAATATGPDASVIFEVTEAGATGCSLSGADLTAATAGICLVSATASATNYFDATTTSAITVVSGPAITAVSPPVISSAGGTVVTISGSALGGGTGVGSDPLPNLVDVELACGGTSVSATSPLATASGSTVSAVMPACATLGATLLRVTTSDGNVEYPVTVVQAPTVTSISPDWSLPAGGGTITVTGTGFVAGETSVQVGAGTPVNATVASDTSLTFTAPSGALGTYDLSVIVGGVVSTTAAQAFAYQDVPLAPATISAVPGDQQVDLSWAAATPNARSLTGYVILQADGAAEPPVWTEIVTVSASTREHTVTGLTNGTSYRFGVLGYNEVGRGDHTISALATPYTLAAAPTALAAAVKTPTNGVGSGQVVLTWTDGDSGGLDITSYDVEVSPDGSAWSTPGSLVTGSATATVSALTNGADYFFRVRAVTEAGPGAWSSSVGPVTPRDVPLAPYPVAAEAKTPTNGLSGNQVLITWIASVSNGAVVTGYVVEQSDGSGWVPASATITGTTATVSGLTTGLEYQLRVLAVNDAGTTSASVTPVLATPRDVPDAPAPPTLTVTSPTNGVPGGGLKVDWVAPASNNGSVVTNYEVVVSAGGSIVATHHGSGTSHTFTGLTNGTEHSVTVAAFNAAGWSAGSTATTATPIDVPDAPASPTLTVTTPDNGVPGAGLKVDWVAPASDNGSVVTSYEVVVSAAGIIVATHSGSGTSHTFTGLANGTLHSVTVAAQNAAGWSPDSSASTATPRDVPGTPTSVTAVPVSDGALQISWLAPATNGAAIVRYDVTVSASGQTTEYCDTSGSTLTCTISSLALGVAYDVSVSATNAAGRSLEGTATGTPRAVPAAPTAPTVSAKTPLNGVAGGQVVVTWDVPDDKGDPITSYVVTTATTEDGTYTVPGSITIVGTTATISGLTNGQAVYVKVAATNGAGTSSPSPAGSATPRDVTDAPAAPTLEVKTPTNGVAATEVKATWSLPSVTNGATVIGYEVVLSAGGTILDVYHGAGTTTTFTGLQVGSTYSVTVAALNAAGWSAASTANAATPRDVPDAPAAPTLLVKAPSNDVPGGGLRVTWTEPAINGAPITNYEVIVSDGSAIVATHYGVGTSHTFTDLTNGTLHSVTVAAFNAAGWSAASAASTATPIDVPSSPTSLAVEARTPTNGLTSTQLLLTWTAPAQNNGSAVADYVVESSTDNSTWSPATVTITGTTATVSGLTTSTLTHLRVSAVNAAGTSSASTPIQATPRDVPGAPTAVTAVGKTPANGLAGTELRVAWTAPAANGDAITGYLVEQSTDGSNWESAAGSVTGTSQTVTGLTTGTEYEFRVFAINGAGTSSASATVSATARDVPSQMEDPTVEAMTPSNELSGGQLKVSWSPPADNGAVIELFVATASATGQTTRVCEVIAANCVITGLTNGVAYDVVTSAVNAAGTSTPSTSTTGTPRTVPGAPTGIAATVRNTTDEGVWNNVPDNALTVTWTAPADNGGNAITGYTATATAAGQDPKQCTTASTTCIITGLSTGVAYTVTVSATNGAGTGAAGTAAATARPLAVPGAPTGVVAVRGNTTLTVTWTAPTISARGGATIVGYVAQASPGGGFCETNGAASCPIPGLSNGTAYTVTVAAVNSAGRGADSTPSSAVTPATLPSAPATVSAVTAGSGQLLVSWDLAAGNGATVTTYSATAAPGGITCVTSADSCQFERLTNGTDYTFTVVATNAVGDSAASAASTAVKPLGLPSAPLRVVALPTSSALRVTWEAPVDNGGSAVTSYTATAISGGNQFVCTTANLTCTITGLTNQTTYTVTVTATTAVGTSPASASVSATPLAPPTPAQFAAAVAQAAVDALGVSDPVAGSAISLNISGFEPSSWVVIGVSSDPTALGAVQADGGGNVTAQVTLPPEIGAGNHTLSVINPSTGTSRAQPVTVQAPSVPGAPGQPTVVAGSGSGVVDVTFAAPSSDGGATITSYVVTANPGAATCVRATAGTCTIVGLTPGTAYTFTVRAENSVGESPASTASAAFTPKARPGAAGTVTATADVNVTGKVTVAWTAAAANGATVTYVVRAVQDPTKSCTTTSLTCDITGLPTYVALTFEVLTSNSEGAGPASAASSAVTLVLSLPASPREDPGVSAGSVASGTPTAGGSATINVTGFDPFEWVTIVVQSTPQVLSTLQANNVGVVSTTVTVPSGLAVGTHYLTVLSDVRADGTRRGVTQSFSVAASNPSNPGSGSNPGTGGGSPTPAPTFPADRFAGADRYATSVQISQENFSPGVAVVYLATGANYADALAAGAASGGSGPVLLTQRNSLPEDTRAELARLRPRRIVVLGGTSAISNTVLDAARSYATESTTRLGGVDRYATAAEVSAATFSTNVEVVYVATGTNFADALAAGGAARGRGPVLLVQADAIPDATAAELTRLRPRRIVVLGGTTAVRATVQTALAAYTTGSVSRVGGADRYATAADLSRATFAPGVAVAYVATGTNFADALSAAALGAPVLLARPTCIPASTKAELDRLGATRVVVLGGTAALSDGVRRLTPCS